MEHYTSLDNRPGKLGAEILNGMATTATSATSPSPVMPTVPIRFGHARLGYRWTRYLGWSIRKHHLQGAGHALAGLGHLGLRSTVDLARRTDDVVCNICGWSGARFYPNVGPGYYEKEASCPRCSCIHRYRSLAVVLGIATDFFTPEKSVIEVAPVRSFQSYCLWRKNGQNYRSFDLERFAMEQGDLTAMHYSDASADFFLCYHVLEHVPADRLALAEIFRVLRPGGTAILQVPIDWSLSDTVEYGRPNERETGHVRRYSESGFHARIAEAGFEVSKLRPSDLLDESIIARHGLNREPIFFGRKPR